MLYRSDLTGKRIRNEADMVIVSFYDETAGEFVLRYLKDLKELKDWWLAGMPNKGGAFEESDFDHAEIINEKKKISLNWKGQTFVFTDVKEAKDWYNEVSKSKSE